MPAVSSLFDLLNLSLGTPEVGAVNFKALYALLRGILGHLNIQDLNTDWTAEDGSPPVVALPKEKPSSYQHMENRLQHTEEQMAALEMLPTGTELLSGTSSGVTDMWQQMQLRRKVQSNEDGVSKSMALIQDLLNEIRDLKESQGCLQNEVQMLREQLSQLNLNELLDRISTLEKGCHQVVDLENVLQELQKKMELYPDPKELTQYITWDVLQMTLVREQLQQQFQDQQSVPVASMSCDLAISPVPSPQRSQSDGVPWQVSSGAERYPETMDALRHIGQLRERHSSLEVQVAQLETSKADQAQLQHLRELLTANKDVPDNLLEELNQGDAEKLMGDIWTTNVSEFSKTAEMEHLDLERQDQATDRQLRLQIEYLRSVVKRLDEEVQLLKGGDTSKHVTEKPHDDMHLQDQLDKLRAMLEGMMSSSSSLLSQSLTQDQSGQERGQGKVGEAVEMQDPTCLVNISRKVSQLFQWYEKLQDMVSGFVKEDSSSQPVRSVKTSGLMSDVQGAILQLHAECGKLQSTTGHLVEEHSLKQKHIDELYKSVKQLEDKKADKDLVEMEIEIKADKQALETKVSQMQFDTMTEQLQLMFTDLLSKISGQEQDWNKVIEKISTEMECKLNRIELDPLKKQLEDRWKRIRKQLQAQPTLDLGNAAGIRKQLVARFHCISCDRPVDMMTSGPQLVKYPTIPSARGLPAYKSNRPSTVYELEQVRQHHRSDPIPESTDYSNPPMSRSCGGNHTLTYSNRRCTRLRPIAHFIQAEEEAQNSSLSGSTVGIQVRQPEVVDILGLDGQIYKGRMDKKGVRSVQSRLPNTAPKEGEKTKK